MLGIAEAVRAHLGEIDLRHDALPEGRSEGLDLCTTCLEPWPCDIRRSGDALRQAFGGGEHGT
jgi:hypothetical protein